jgi:hypothetical protein
MCGIYFDRKSAILFYKFDGHKKARDPINGGSGFKFQVSNVLQEIIVNTSARFSFEVYV